MKNNKKLIINNDHVLSPFYKHNIHKHKIYPYIYHYYLAHKFKTDKQWVNLILKELNISKLLKMSKSRRHKIVPKWDLIKKNVMTNAYKLLFNRYLFDTHVYINVDIRYKYHQLGHWGKNNKLAKLITLIIQSSPSLRPNPALKPSPSS